MNAGPRVVYPVSDPLMEYVDRLNIRESERHELIRLYEMQRIALQGSPQGGGPVAPPTPGKWTSEFFTTMASMLAIAAICVGLVLYTAQLDALDGEIKAIVFTLIGSVASWALKNLGINYTDSRTQLKAGRL